MIELPMDTQLSQLQKHNSDQVAECSLGNTSALFTWMRGKQEGTRRVGKVAGTGLTIWMLSRA